MLITKINIQNYKTYQNLDLDLNVEEGQGRSIILIGGENGGGKTTLFESISGALYGLNIKTEADFLKLVNLGIPDKTNARISLSITFTGQLLNHTKSYTITRFYQLNKDKKVVFSVSCSIDGHIIRYGSESERRVKEDGESKINKVIKANLPEELSKYFLFDGLAAGNILSAGNLSNLISENIESVMGFKKYKKLSERSNQLFIDKQAEKIHEINLREQYSALSKERIDLEKTKSETEKKLNELNSKKVDQNPAYDNAIQGRQSIQATKKKIDYKSTEKSDIIQSEKQYIDSVNEFLADLSSKVAIPFLINNIKPIIAEIIKEHKSNEISDAINDDLLNKIIKHTKVYLKKQNLDADNISERDLVNYVKIHLLDSDNPKKFNFLENTEIDSLDNLQNYNITNEYEKLINDKVFVTNNQNRFHNLTSEIESIRSIENQDPTSIIENFEALKEDINNTTKKLVEETNKLRELNLKIDDIQIEPSQEPDAKFEMLKKFKTFFDELGNRLLEEKKFQIEKTLKENLNICLSSYKNQIEKVEFTDSLKNLSFKIFHKNGNEIYLDELNTASKQLVVQVLLKALRDAGDYNPPIMIDTIFGAFDVATRNIVMESYFPSLGHQVILLSSDSEISPENDFHKIVPFVAKKYTLKRNAEHQFTTVENNYFGK